MKTTTTTGPHNPLVCLKPTTSRFFSNLHDWIYPVYNLCFDPCQLSSLGFPWVPEVLRTVSAQRVISSGTSR